MKVLFTGASSFSGFWFVQALAKYGHEVVAVFQRQAHDYEGLRAHRVSALEGVCRREFACSFGTDRFFLLWCAARNTGMFFVITPPMCTIIKALILTLTPHWPITHAASKKCCRYLKRTVVKNCY